MVRLEDMVVGRVYRITHRAAAHDVDADGWLWVWEGKNDGTTFTPPWPSLKSIATGEEEEFEPAHLEAADGEG
jgi:hypothetical protein